MKARKRSGLTLLEVLLAMFIFVVGIIGVLAALPTGINSATWVVFQDASIHLAHSKFSEFRRDRVDPATAFLGGSSYFASGSYTPGKQEPVNSSGDPWRDFAHGPGEPYQYFDDIDRYEWKVESVEVKRGSGTVPAAPAGFYFPDKAGTSVALYKVTVTVRMKGSVREFQFSQLMTAYD